MTGDGVNLVQSTEPFYEEVITVPPAPSHSGRDDRGRRFGTGFWSGVWEQRFYLVKSLLAVQ